MVVKSETMDAYATKDDLLRMLADITKVRDAASVSLKEYFDVRLEGTVSATTLARQNMEHRLSALNELRGALEDQNKLFVTKDEFCMLQEKYDSERKGVLETIKSLELTRASVDGKASRASADFAMALAVVGILIGIAGLIASLVS